MADALPRLAALSPAEMDAEQFARLTRRAISHFGDLPRLAASPLTALPQVQAQGGDNPLDRARALKALLSQSIARLKPQGEYGFTAEWRFYNALYYPYVAGLKPYALQPGEKALDEAARQTLGWLRSSVPERTLHNWQNAAARLVADDIRAEDIRRSA